MRPLTASPTAQGCPSRQPGMGGQPVERVGTRPVAIHTTRYRYSHQSVHKRKCRFGQFSASQCLYAAAHRATLQHYRAHVPHCPRAPPAPTTRPPSGRCAASNRPRARTTHPPGAGTGCMRSGPRRGRAKGSRRARSRQVVCPVQRGQRDWWATRTRGHMWAHMSVHMSRHTMARPVVDREKAIVNG